MHAAQDEFPRIILAPGDPQEGFVLGLRAFNLADVYQMPVIILTDKYFAESLFTVSLDAFNVKNSIDRGKMIPKQGDLTNPNAVYKRYDPDVKDGISPRAIPGTPGHLFLANSDEHDVYGYSEEDDDNRVRQMNKRMRKLESFVKNGEARAPIWYGKEGAQTTLLCWGSTKNSCLEVLKYHDDINVLHFTHLFPLDILKLDKELKKVKKGIAVEGNYSGLFADYLYEKTGFEVEKEIVKYDGRPFFVEELMQKIK